LARAVRPAAARRGARLASTAWLLADLLDFLGQEDGQRERFGDRIVELLVLSVDPEPGGGG
jgi:hypothetical protein